MPPGLWFLPTANGLRGCCTIVEDRGLNPEGGGKQSEGQRDREDDLKEQVVLHETSPGLECSLGGYPNQGSGFL